MKAPAADEVGALFQLPLGDFTRARDALAARLKGAGDSVRAATVKSLAKPTLSAWVVNQVTAREGFKFDALLSAVAALREAQRSGSDLRVARESHRQALRALSRSAAERLREASGGATPEMMRRIGGTLEALATLGIPPGQLSRDLDPPGFEALTALPLATATASQRGGALAGVLPFGPTAGGEKRRRELERQREVARVAARRAVEEALAEARGAHQNAERTVQALTGVLQRVQDARLEQGRLERLLVEAAAAVASSEAESRRLERESRLAKEAAKAAELRCERAREQLGE